MAKKMMKRRVRIAQRQRAATAADSECGRQKELISPSSGRAGPQQPLHPYILTLENGLWVISVQQFSSLDFSLMLGMTELRPTVRESFLAGCANQGRCPP